MPITPAPNRLRTTRRDGSNRPIPNMLFNHKISDE
jgi:hypothetical protein